MSDSQASPTPIRRTSRPHARRRLLRTILLAGGILGASLSGFLPIAFAKRARLRPPGALDEHDFLASCIKCGQCVQVCPVQAIRLSDLVDGFGVGVPHIEPRDQACDFSCDAGQCILACPTGALTYRKPSFFPTRAGAMLPALPILKAKAKDPDPNVNFRERMGLARLVRPEACRAAQGKDFHGLARGAAFRGRMRYTDVDRWKPIRIAERRYDRDLCDLCVTECPIKGALTMETFTTPEGNRHRQPVVHDACVGCGVCEMICPVETPCIVVEGRAVWKA
ncbi:MAG TPA: 4Fe-4S dicluster domain-containing protein [Burkholderiaceae bacterium]|nr:4Fe-4S dicluster domain-containing protein [Burkholderiaceae bacterium]